MTEPRAGLDLQEDESLPWLEPADETNYDSGISPSRLAILVITAVVLIAVIVGGIAWLARDRDTAQGTLIAAPRGDYKVPPQDADARAFEGEGDASYAASEGAEPQGRIDLGRTAEQPAVNRRADRADVPAPGFTDIGPASAPRPTPSATARPAIAPANAAIEAAPIAPGSAVVQLGAYLSRARANQAWTDLNRRHPELAERTPAISTATVGGGTVVRLRTILPSRSGAETLCAAMRAKGENCIVVG